MAAPKVYCNSENQLKLSKHSSVRLELESHQQPLQETLSSLLSTGWFKEQIQTVHLGLSPLQHFTSTI